MLSCCGEVLDWSKTQRHDINGCLLLECLICGNAYMDETRRIHYQQGSILEMSE